MERKRAREVALLVTLFVERIRPLVGEAFCRGIRREKPSDIMFGHRNSEAKPLTGSITGDEMRQ